MSRARSVFDLLLLLRLKHFSLPNSRKFTIETDLAAAVVAVGLVLVDLNHRRIPTDLISMAKNTSKLHPLEATVVVEVR